MIREEFLKLVSDRQNGRLDAETLLHRSEELLEGISLYPPATVMTLGIAAADVLDVTPGMAIDVVLKLMSSTVREVRATAAAMVSRFARYQPGFWLDAVRHLVTDEDWEVRDLAAHSFDTREFGDGAAEFHLEFVSAVVRDWVNSPDPLIRRAATQALLGYAARHPEFRAKLVALLSLLLDDPSEYVRDNHAAALLKVGRLDPPLLMDYIESCRGTAGAYGRETLRNLLEQPFASTIQVRRAELLSKLTPLDPPLC